MIIYLKNIIFAVLKKNVVHSCNEINVSVLKTSAGVSVADTVFQLTEIQR